MPFGTLFAAIVIAIFGVARGVRLFGAGEAPLSVLGASLVLLALAVAAGLLFQRAWARWLGIGACLVLVGAGAASFDFLPLLACALAAILLVVPKTGAPERAGEPSLASRALLGTAVVAIVAGAGAAAWALARVPATRSGSAAKAPTLPDRATWVGFAKGLDQAKSEKKLMVVDFYATWCNPCKIMEKRTLRDPRVEARLKDVVPVRVDAEEEVERDGLVGIDLATRYAIESYPTIVVIDAEGREVARNVGLLGAEEFLSWLDAVLERAATSVARS